MKLCYRQITASFRTTVKNNLASNYVALLAKNTRFDYALKELVVVNFPQVNPTDWQMGINNCDLWGTASVGASGSVAYTLYLRDIYDFEPDKDDDYSLLGGLLNVVVSDLQSMAHLGLARAYLVNGSTPF